MLRLLSYEAVGSAKRAHGSAAGLAGVPLVELVLGNEDLGATVDEALDALRERMAEEGEASVRGVEARLDEVAFCEHVLVLVDLGRRQSCRVVDQPACGGGDEARLVVLALVLPDLDIGAQLELLAGAERRERAREGRERGAQPTRVQLELLKGAARECLAHLLQHLVVEVRVAKGHRADDDAVAAEDVADL